VDWKLALTTFGTIFLAELGDKTQLATLAIASGGKSRWAVFLAAALALTATSAAAVLAGEALTRAAPLLWLRRAAGAACIAVGIWFVLARPE
jgi:putative Ca2+/H+ antiporter (TMEM165/GDT1 family)